MTTDRTVTTLVGSGIGYRHIFLAVHPFRPHQVALAAGVNIMTGEAGDSIFLTGMQEVQVTRTVAEAVLGGLLLGNQRHVMAFKTEFLHRHAKLILVISGMGCMAAEAVILHNRWMHAFLGGFIIMTLVADLGTLVLDRIQAVIHLVVAVADGMTRSALLIGKAAMNKRGLYFAGVTTIARLSADRIDSTFRFSSHNVRMDT